MHLLEGADFFDDLAFRGEAAFFAFGKEDVVAYGDDEDAAAAADEFTLHAQCFLELGRQTGGPGEVVSNAAVVDSNAQWLRLTWFRRERP